MANQKLPYTPVNQSKLEADTKAGKRVSAPVTIRNRMLEKKYEVAKHRKEIFTVLSRMNSDRES